MINIDDFAKLEIRIGEIKSAEKVEGSDRLLVFKVDLGEEQTRQIASGVAGYFSDPQELVGRQVPVVANLEPRTIRGVESQGMILYVSDDEIFTTLNPGQKIKNGSLVK
ncbi:methionine--tRNA ligase subunit beta [Candidatus Campbellbacteria bacterium RIFCSPLOWO2_01_FULL_34_15]|uniref:Methionine--tRNA ligase n=2 Tax=Candidatus Campbelliibacteriota TaxID=1752727 RepID=A0A1F5EMJ5_9BACT|nr:MAG: methionine--tRNA ligase subunit beta [Candidatus Campbellbacteria bacterium RIFCSPHIGHO2_01_FULL_34_10]OGD68530.1 MAG: methionine--tRNA ligase subunit beta [Candidatus Campbellbacteria bacterium RIFCSPLOWO2_01_FULL_34_15]